MPERSLLSITARTAYWLGWHRHFGPASGSDPKIGDPLGRYCMAVFTGDVNIGPYDAARHIAGVSARELSMVRNRHIDLKKLNSAIRYGGVGGIAYHYISDTYGLVHDKTSVM